MSRAGNDSAPIPTIGELGEDLLRTSTGQRWLVLGRPLVAIGIYCVTLMTGLWPLAPIAVFIVFVTVVTATHDVVHRSIGLGRKSTEIWLFVLGAMLGASGHSYRATHLQHHRVFPGADDPEGEPARMTFWQAVLHGPVFLPKLWLWSFRRAGPGSALRRWLLAEALVAPLAIVAGLLTWPTSIGLLAYVIMVLNGAWVFPLLTVHLPHRDYGDSPLTQTHTVRDPVVSRVFLELTYHLEHHLHPQVPTHHLAELAERLQPTLEEQGVVPQRLFFVRRRPIEATDDTDDTDGTDGTDEVQNIRLASNKK